MTTIKRIALTLVIIGAVNWGLIGLFQFDLVAAIFGGQDAALSRVIYTLVGLSGLYCLTMLFEPMAETTKDIKSDRNINTNNVSYGTEFGEEMDLTQRATDIETDEETNEKKE
ncbi:DUF378 domain-containing protein [Virgibacillus sp. DJP39]|uniref:DUF378 domain-containing protein n=1 Tax=Virgibacillus sp. DJP39 TaxID=3409790 RepID=UPI003BB6C212